MTENSIGDVFNTEPRVADPTWLPEPESRERTHLLISVDDHVVEAPDMFEGRMPAHLADRAPKVIETDSGEQYWEFNGNRFPNITPEASSHSMSVIVILDLSVDPAQRNDSLQMLGEMFSVTRGAEGCQSAEVVTDMDDSGRILLIERCDERASREAYLATRAEDGSSAKLGEMVSAKPTVTYTELHGA